MFGSMLADTKYRKTSQQRKVMIWAKREPVRTKNKTAVNTASVAKITNWLAKHRHTVNTRKSSRNDNDNDNDNDTLREVPHLSSEGLALQARVYGVMTPRKRICCAFEACSLASCACTNCYGQLAMHLILR